MSAISARAGAARMGERASLPELLARRPGGFLALAVILTAILSLGITGLPALHVPGLQTDAGVDLLADLNSPGYADQKLFADTFGADPVVIMVEAPGNVDLLTGAHFIGLASLEGDLACKVNKKGTACDPRPGVKKVYGPGTVVNTLALEATRRGLETCAAAAQEAQRAAAAAGKSQQDQQAAFDAAAKACANQLAAEYPSIGVPAINNPGFIKTVLIGPDGNSRAYWRWALPDPHHALISVRMDRHATLQDIRDLLAVVTQHERKAAANARGGVSTQGDLSDLKITVTGSPVLALSLADSVQRSLLLLLPLTLLVMVAVTVFALRLPLRLLAVPLAALAAFWTAGAAGLARLPVTPATLAVLPVVLGLTIDYSLQAVNRLADEEQGGPVSRVVRASRSILPPTAIAAIATVAGVLAFALMPVPLVRQFGLFLAIGVAAAYLSVLIVGIPLFSLVLRSDLRRFLARPAAKPEYGWLARAGRLPGWALLPLAVAGLLGWAALPGLQVETDPARLMPAGDPSVTAARHVQDRVGLAGEIDLVVTGPAVASPPVVQWMAEQDKSLGGSDGLQPEQSLASFLSAFNQGQVPDQQLTDTVLQRMPDYFTGAVLSRDRAAGRSAFAVTRVGSVQQDAQAVDRLRSAPAPPAGYHAFPAGLAVLASDALRELRRDMLPINLLALVFVLAVLLAAFRRPWPALVCVLPTAVAAGWATGLLWLLRVEANPITVLLAGVVVAFATEFSVLWLTRYSSERRGGAEPDAAAAAASARVGPAILASALALVLGFAVLGVSNVPMVREFGLFSAADLALATLAVLVLLPPAVRRVMA